MTINKKFKNRLMKANAKFLIPPHSGHWWLSRIEWIPTFVRMTIKKKFKNRLMKANAKFLIPLSRIKNLSTKNNEFYELFKITIFWTSFCKNIRFITFHQSCSIQVRFPSLRSMQRPGLSDRHIKLQYGGTAVLLLRCPTASPE